MGRHYDDPAYRRIRGELRGKPCHYCGAWSDTIDHIRAVARGGTNDPSNLVPACRSCNSRRGAYLGHSRRRRKNKTKTHRNRRW